MGQPPKKKEKKKAPNMYVPTRPTLIIRAEPNQIEEVSDEFGLPFRLQMPMQAFAALRSDLSSLHGVVLLEDRYI